MLPGARMAEIFTKEVHILHGLSEQMEFTQEHIPGRGFPGGSVVKNPHANTGDKHLIPGLGRSPGGGNGSSLQYSC